MISALRGVTVSVIICFFTYFTCYAVDQAFEEKREAITKAFKVAFGVPLPDQIQPLVGGYSSPGIYKVVISEKSYVIRLSHPKRKLEDEIRTIHCMRMSAKRGLSPKVYYANPHDGIVIMEYIEAPKAPWEVLTSKKNLKKLALMLRTLHNGPQFPDFLTIFDVRRMFERTIGDPKPLILGDIARSLEKIEWWKRHKNTAGSCHNDLKPDNVLFDGERFWIIDWEAASKGDTYFDLATVCIYFALTPHQEAFFVKNYFGKDPTLSQVTHLHKMKQAALSYYGTAYLMVSKNLQGVLQPPPNFEMLPTAEQFLKAQIQKPATKRTSENIEKIGWILLNQARNNLEKDEKLATHP